MSKGSQIDFLIEIKYPPFYGEMQTFISLASIKFKCEETSDELIQRFWKKFGEDLEELVKEDATELTPRGIETLRQFLTETNAYRKYLRDLPEAEFAELYKKEKLARQTRQDARQEAFDRHRFFNEPEAVADFEYWAACAAWTVEEAVALSFGKEPSVVNSETIVKEVKSAPSPFARTFERQKRLVLRAIAAGDLADPLVPTTFLEWAHNNSLCLPPQLVEFVRPNLTMWKDRCQKLEDELQSLRSQLDSAKIRELSTREKHTLQKMVLTMALAKFGYDPKKRNSAAKMIASFSKGFEGLSLCEETAKDWLDEAVRELDFQQNRES